MDQINWQSITDLLEDRCSSDSDCFWLYECKFEHCSHIPIFPLTIYPAIIYLLVPFACGLVNMTGNSMGIFKVLFLMDFLRYNVGQATALIQPMVAGTAITNFFFIIFKRHPTKNTSLVNYSIVYILIPSCLFGSTLGSLLLNFVPQIAQDSLIVIVFTFFAYNFFIKARTFTVHKSKNEKLIIQKQITEEQQGINNTKLLKGYQNSVSLNQIQSQPKIEGTYKFRRIQTIESYEATMHIPDIVASIGAFLVFQVLVFLVQGKFSFFKFNKCDWQYPVGVIILGIVTFIYLAFIKRFLKRKFDDYESAGYPLEIKINTSKKFYFVAMGGLGAGFMQGILGVGSGTCIMAVLLALQIPPTVASACSGYQIFFIGSAAMIQKFIEGDLVLVQISFLFGLTCIVGGIVTFFMYRFLHRRDMSKVNQILIYIIMVLCIISVVGTIPSFILTVINFGWQEVLKIKWQC